MPKSVITSVEVYCSRVDFFAVAVNIARISDTRFPTIALPFPTIKEKQTIMDTSINELMYA